MTREEAVCLLRDYMNAIVQWKWFPLQKAAIDSLNSKRDVLIAAILGAQRPPKAEQSPPVTFPLPPAVGKPMKIRAEVIQKGMSGKYGTVSLQIEGLGRMELGMAAPVDVMNEIAYRINAFEVTHERAHTVPEAKSGSAISSEADLARNVLETYLIPGGLGRKGMLLWDLAHLVIQQLEAQIVELKRSTPGFSVDDDLREAAERLLDHWARWSIQVGPDVPNGFHDAIDSLRAALAGPKPKDNNDT